WLLVLVTCTLQVGAQQVDGASNSAPDGFGRIFVYRFGNPRSDFHPTLRINGEPFARALPRAYVVLDVPTGNYEISGARNTQRIVEVEVQDNSDAYVQVDVLMKPTRQAVYVELMDPWVGGRHVRRLGFREEESPGIERNVVAVIGDVSLALQLSEHLALPHRRVIVGATDWDAFEQGLAVQNSAVVRILPPQQAASLADVLLLNIPRSAAEALVEEFGDWSGKVIVDQSFAWTTGDDGYPTLESSVSGAEVMQELLPDSLVVGALVQPARWQKHAKEIINARGHVYLASDSADAKAAVAELYTRAGFQTNDFGGLRMSRMLEQLQLIRLVPLLQGESYGLDVVVTPADEKGAQ
ncbi:MAG: hypothetical protein P8X81_12925, partial [Woeseiaceae bacterium]